MHAWYAIACPISTKRWRSDHVVVMYVVGSKELLANVELASACSKKGAVLPPCVARKWKQQGRNLGGLRYTRGVPTPSIKLVSFGWAFSAPSSPSILCVILRSIPQAPGIATLVTCQDQLLGYHLGISKRILQRTPALWIQREVVVVASLLPKREAVHAGKCHTEAMSMLLHPPLHLGQGRARWTELERHQHGTS